MGLVQSKTAKDRALKALSEAKSPAAKSAAIARLEEATREIAEFRQRLEAHRAPPQAAPPPKLRVVKPAAVAPPPAEPEPKWHVVHGFAHGQPTTALEMDDEEEEDEDDDDRDVDPDDDDDSPEGDEDEGEEEEIDMDQPTKKQSDAANANMIEARVRATMPKTDASAFRPFPEPRGLEASAEELADAQAACDAAKARALAPKRGGSR